MQAYTIENQLLSGFMDNKTRLWKVFHCIKPVKKARRQRRYSPLTLGSTEDIKSVCSGFSGIKQDKKKAETII